MDDNALPQSRPDDMNDYHHHSEDSLRRDDEMGRMHDDHQQGMAGHGDDDRISDRGGMGMSDIGDGGGMGMDGGMGIGSGGMMEGATGNDNDAASGSGGYMRPIFLGNLSHGCLASDIENIFHNPVCEIRVRGGVDMGGDGGR